MNLFSKIVLLTVAGVRIGRSIAVMLDELWYKSDNTLSSLRKRSKTNYSKSSSKKVETSESSSRFEGLFSNKRLLQKSEKLVCLVSILFSNAAEFYILHYFPQLKKNGIIY